MPATTGVAVLLRVGNSRRTITLANGSAGETYTLTFEGQTTAAIAYDALAGAVQAALEALSNLEVGDVTVAGAAGGPYTVTFAGRIAGQQVENFTAQGETGDLTATVTDPGPTYVTVAGQRNATLNRGANVVDTTNKTTAAGWEENLPTYASWSIDCDAVVISDDAGRLALLNAWRYRRRVNALIDNGDGTTESGVGTITEFPDELPHDDIVTCSLSIQGSGELTPA